MRAALLTIILFLITSSVTHAEDNRIILARTLTNSLDVPSDKSDIADASRRLFEDSVDRMIKERVKFTKVSPSQSENIILTRREFFKRRRDDLSTQSIRERLAQAYSEQFTEDQLKRLIEIYTDKTFLIHSKSVKVIAESLRIKSQNKYEEDNEWFNSEMDKILAGK